MNSIVTLRIDIDLPLHRQLSRVATDAGRSMAWVIDQSLRAYVAARADAADVAGEAATTTRHADGHEG